MHEPQNFSSSTILKSKQNHQCKICERKLCSGRSLKRHMLIHTGEKTYKCDVCSKLFLTKCYLQSHEIMHTRDKKYKCDVCSRLFHRRHNLKAHEMTHPEKIHGNKLHKCDICCKPVQSKYALMEHKMIHNDERNEKCDVCSKLFRTKSTLLKHKRTHSEKRYKCNICLQLFRKSCDLIVHKRIHSNKHFYKCDICSKLFPRKANLQKHEMTHSNYQCFECGQNFSNKRALICHLEVHKKLSFKCDKRTNVFISKEELQKHCKVHIETFFCNLCPLSFSEKLKLQSHICTKHNASFNVQVSSQQTKNKCHKQSIKKSCSVVLQRLDNMMYDMMARNPATTDDVHSAPVEVKVESMESLLDESKPLNVSIIYNDNEDLEHEICQTSSAIENQIVKSENSDEVDITCCTGFCKCDLDKIKSEIYD